MGAGTSLPDCQVNLQLSTGFHWDIKGLSLCTPGISVSICHPRHPTS